MLLLQSSSIRERLREEGAECHREIFPRMLRGFGWNSVPPWDELHVSFHIWLTCTSGFDKLTVPSPVCEALLLERGGLIRVSAPSI